VTTSTEESDIIRVSSSSSVQDVAAALAHKCYDDHRATMRAVGAGAVNQAAKAVAVARGFAAPRGLDLVCRIGFTSIPGRDGKDISAVTFFVFVT
jgi:stage V sporulation protein S